MTSEPERRDVSLGTLLTEVFGQQSYVFERIAPLLRAARWRAFIMWGFVINVLVTLVIAIWLWRSGTLRKDWLDLIVPSLIFGGVIYLLSSLLSTWSSIQALIEGAKTSAATSLKAEELQDRLDENFFTNLVKINFKYLDQYYLQTQLQASKSFILCSVAASVSLFVILAGIVMLFLKPNQAQAGYVATAAGTLGEFISAVFFYLYNQTILKMGEYHQKLVLTQNVSLALKISEELPANEQVIARSKLIEYLSKDINFFLTTQPESDAGHDPQSSRSTRNRKLRRMGNR